MSWPPPAAGISTPTASAGYGACCSTPAPPCSTRCSINRTPPASPLTRARRISARFAGWCSDGSVGVAREIEQSISVAVFEIAEGNAVLEALGVLDGFEHLGEGDDRLAIGQGDGDGLIRGDGQRLGHGDAYPARCDVD